MFLEIIKDARSNRMRSFGLVSKEEMVKKHPFSLDIRGWADGGRMNTRFGISTSTANYLYVKTNKTDMKELEAIARVL